MTVEGKRDGAMQSATLAKKHFYIPSKQVHGTSLSQCPLEEWEVVGEVVATVNRPCRDKGRAGSVLQVVHHAGQFLVAHATLDGIWVELHRVSFRSRKQALEFAETQVTMRPNFENMWD